ncbi:MAG: FAD-dependent oxidoreductase [Polyangiaceae bacterium]|nr:FAD-dependent oxidoreductase [Polyangiaceae bacterium]
MRRVVVVGASLAGLRSVEALRRKKFDGHVVLIGDEPHLPYDRPPLSKEILRGEWEPERLALRKRGFEDLDCELRMGERAVRLSVDAHEIELATGERLSYDGLVIATGATARRLPNQPDLEGIFELRTVDDALALRAALRPNARVCVIGAGFIGAEVAASAVSLGYPVTMVEGLMQPMVRGLGERIGAVMAEIHRQKGVDLRLGVNVRAIEGEGRVERVLLSDGSTVACDVVVVGIGVRPATAWLEGSGLVLDDGVVCDATCLAAPGVVAVGDVSRWYNPLFEETMRVEHWTHAVEQARHAIDTLLAPEGEAKPFESAPIFWTDQFGIKIQGAGRPANDDLLHVCHGSLEERRFVALFGRNDRIVGVVTFDNPARLFQYRKLIAERASWGAALGVAQAD